MVCEQDRGRIGGCLPSFVIGSFQLAASNAKQAFAAGLGHGLGKPLLMLAHHPYVTPLDYRDLLRVHETAAQAEAAFDEWFSPLIEKHCVPPAL